MFFRTYVLLLERFTETQRLNLNLKTVTTSDCIYV